MKGLALIVVSTIALAPGMPSKEASSAFDKSSIGNVKTVSAATKDALEDSVTKALGAIYATEDSSVMILEKQQFELISSGSVVGELADTVEDIADEVPMSDEALDQVGDLADAESDLGLADLPMGMEIPVMVEARIVPESIDVNVDNEDSSMIVDASAILSQIDEDGIASESRVVSTSIFDADQTLTSFHIYTEVDFANQAALDPSSPDAEQNIVDGPGSAADMPLKLDFVDSSGGDEAESGDLTSAIAPDAFIAQEAGSISTAGMSTSQRNAAVAYAQKHAYSYNKNYRKYTADCTNFVSQAMAAGGWKRSNGWRWEDKAWWHKTLDSYTWAGSENFYKYTRNVSKRGTYLSSLSQVRTGDVIQAKRKGQKNMSHTMIVTKKQGSDIRVSYHSNDRKDYSLASFMASKEFQGATYFAHRI